ncbi:hypothetical protein [Gracilinema caldarium]|uniref:Uncharacterized protein n=1 Tax=Gracilinema caldarium (strain ATCC 51460 / DSM 7334 / H1) TaxID=744872 RepID=F8F0F5_GRAC1|nr:hypothetical protein [Gracilinema caldarium]AEJ19299.1 hypothetical protein Spica_1153 [Gracilinema caldarium DSM 7334]
MRHRLVMQYAIRDLFLLCVWALGVLIPLFALPERPFDFPNARLAALGGRHGTLVNDFTALFTNPAGFIEAKEEFSVSELSLSVYGPVFDIADTLVNYFGSSGSLDISGIVGPGGLATGLNLSGPLAFGWVGRGLGFGLFNRTVADAATLGSTIKVQAAEEFLMTGGYSFRVINRANSILDVGFLGKGFVRGRLPLQASILSVTDLFNGNPLDTQPFTNILGVGIDLGILYQYNRSYAVSLVYHDAYSPVLVVPYSSTSAFISGDTASGSGTYNTIKSSLDIGFSVTPQFDMLNRYVSRCTFMADYRDILDLWALIPRNPILNIGVGIEMVVLDALSLRAGIADALPALGFGIDFSVMQFDFAMRGVELGLDPGVQTTYAVDLGLIFRY